MTNYEFLQLSVEEGVATIVLNRPPANALNAQMTYELFQAAVYCSATPAIRAVVLTGADKLFCAGGDLPEFAAADNLDAHLKVMTTHLHAAVSRFARMDAPLIGAINGTAGGAGFSLACACDVTLAAESAKFTLAYTAAGLTPDGSSTYHLPRLVGLRRAVELALTNRRLSSAEALEWGLVNRVVPDDQLLAEAHKLARQLAQGPTAAFGATKRLLANALNESLETQMENEAQSIIAIGKTADAQEGIDAFLNKRVPEFGRKP